MAGIVLLLTVSAASDRYLSGKSFAAVRGMAHMGHLFNSNRVSQRFVSHHDGLARVDVILRSQSGGKAQVILEEADTAAKAAWVAEITPTHDVLTRYAITFSPLDSLGRAYTLTVAAVGQPIDQRATVEVTAVDVYPETRMYLNGQPTSVDLAYRAYYRPTSTSEWAKLVWGEVSYAEILLKRMAQYKPALYKECFLIMLFPLTALTTLTLVSLTTEQVFHTTISPLKTHVARATILGVAIAVLLAGLTVWAMRPLPATSVVAQNHPATGVEKDTGTEQVVCDLLLALERGEVELDRDWFRARRGEVFPSESILEGDWRPAVHMRLPSTASFTTQVPERAALRFAVALLPVAQEMSGAVFIAEVNDTAVFEHLIEPRGTADYRWHDTMVDLSPWEEQKVKITLAARSLEPEGQGFVAWGLPAVTVLPSE
jgi:hypothetical protein